MTKEDIFDKFRELVSTNNKIPVEDIKMESTFEDLNLDSLDGITVLNDIENQYNITLPNDVVMKMKSVREVVDGVYDFLQTPQAKENHQSLEYQRSQIPTIQKPPTNE